MPDLVEERIAAARLAKAKRIAQHVLESAVESLEKLTEQEWLTLAAQSGVNARTAPSDISKRLVIEIVRGWK